MTLNLYTPYSSVLLIILFGEADNGYPFHGDVILSNATRLVGSSAIHVISSGTADCNYTGTCFNVIQTTSSSAKMTITLEDSSSSVNGGSLSYIIFPLNPTFLNDD